MSIGTLQTSRHPDRSGVGVLQYRIVTKVDQMFAVVFHNTEEGWQIKWNYSMEESVNI